VIWQLLHLRARVAHMLRRLEVLDARVRQLEQSVELSTRSTASASVSVSSKDVTGSTESN
jgi:hypothetical protein